MTQTPDLFEMYRWVLMIICSVYTLACLGQTLFGWLDYFSQSRRTQVLGHYAMVLLLRARTRRFARDLWQIALLLVVFAVVVYAHRGLQGPT
ncbi:MAG: hypothetical protein QUV05_06325 [Phycisphaerae bacterium]|nr:hypothetical protein [Phycisphaerae bacterium]